MTLAWIDENGTVRCCSDLCDGCDKREEYGCVQVTVVRGDLRGELKKMLPYSAALNDALWLLHERTFLRSRKPPVAEELETKEDQA